ncbi:MAG: hypothetical protein R2774_01920 [Saprospiraceae bacterium]
MKISWSYIFLIIILGIGCDNYHSRECDAFYYDYNNWQPIDDDNSIKFTSSNNEEITFELEETNLSESYTEGYIGGNCCDNEPETVVCNMRGIFLYYSQSLELDLRIEFWQREIFEQPIEEQTIFYEIAFKEDNDSIFTPLHGFQIEPSFDLLNNNQTTFDSIVLNNQTYFDVIQSEIDTNAVQLNERFSFWRLMASRGKGIIYFADKNGKEYFLKE